MKEKLNKAEEIDKGNLAEYACAKMYEAMRNAERFAAECDRDEGYVAQAISDQLGALARWNMDKAKMYALVFLASEAGDSSPSRMRYQRALRLVEGTWPAKQIPEPRTAA